MTSLQQEVLEALVTKIKDRVDSIYTNDVHTDDYSGEVQSFVHWLFNEYLKSKRAQ